MFVVTLLEVSEREEGVVAIGSLTPTPTPLGCSRYRIANPVPTSPLADDIATTPSGPVHQNTVFDFLGGVCL